MNLNWKQLAIVQIGGSICLPVLMVGQILTQAYSPVSATVAIVAGNLILFGMACVTAFAGATQKKSTAEFAVDLFGERGKWFFVSAMVISMVGWFAIQLSLMGLCLSEWLQAFGFSVEEKVCNIFLGVIIALVGMGGLKGVARLANAISPLLAMTILFAILQPGSYASTNREFSISGISFVVAGSIAAVIDLPTFFREARSTKDALKAAFLLFCIALPLIEGAGAYLYLFHQGENLAELLQGLSIHPLWSRWILLFLILAGWTTNNANMYSAGVSFKQIFPSFKLKYCTLIVAMAGIVLSCLPILENLELFIGAIGVLLSSVGAVMITQLTLWKNSVDPKSSFVNILSASIGTAVGLTAHAKMITFTGIPLLEAFLGTLMIQLIARKYIYETSLS